MAKVKHIKATSIPSVKADGGLYYYKPSGANSYIQYVVDNSGALIPPATIAHGHEISDIVGLQTALNAKAATDDARILNGQTAYTWGTHVGKYLPLTATDASAALPIYAGDLNAYRFTGMSIISASATNKPYVTPGMMISGANGNNVSQLIISRGGDNSYFRGTTSATEWGAWFQLASRTWTIANYHDRAGVEFLLSSKQNTIPAGTTGQYYRGDKTWATMPTIPSLAGYATQTWTTDNFYSRWVIKDTFYDKADVNFLLNSYYPTSNPSGYITASSTNTLTNKSGNISMWTNNMNYTSNTGTVTGVGLLVPTQFEVLSSPINAANPSNNLQFGVKSGYVIPTNAQTSSWDAKLSGSGTSGYMPMWSGTNSFTNSSIRQVTQAWGLEILFDNTRTYGYEGNTAFRAAVNMHTDVAIGKSDYHGRLCIHNQTTASFSPSAAFQIESTTRGFLFSRMNRAQRLAIVSPPALGLHVYQTDTVGDSWRGLKVWDGNQWGHYTVDFIHA